MEVFVETLDQKCFVNASLNTATALAVNMNMMHVQQEPVKMERHVLMKVCGIILLLPSLNNNKY